MKKNLKIYLKILTVILFFSSYISQIGVVESYKKELGYEVHSKMTDKGIKFDNNSKEEYLDIGIDKIKFTKNKSSKDSKYIIKTQNNSNYTIIFSQVEMKISDKSDESDDYNSIYSFKNRDSISPLESKNHIADIDLDRYDFSRVAYVIFKDNVLYNVYYSFDEDLYITIITKPYENQYISLGKKGLDFYVNEKNQIIDSKISDFDFKIEEKCDGKNVNYGQISYKNNSKYPILSMNIYLSKKNNFENMQKLSMQNITILPEHNSPKVLFEYTQNINNYNIAMIEYSILKDNIEYGIIYDAKINRYTLDYFYEKFNKNVYDKIEYTDYYFENNKKKYKKDYIDCNIDNIEIITPNINKKTKYIINQNSKIKNNSKYPMKVKLNLKRLDDNVLINNIGTKDYIINSGKESNLAEIKDLTCINYNKETKLSNKDYEILSLVYEIKINNYRYEIHYHPKLDSYQVFKYD